jgi:lysophospholipase L1-like esterase
MNLKESYNLVVYGDSITKGIVYDNEKCKYATLQQNYANIVGDRIRGTIHNAGRFGNTIIRGFNKLYNEVVKKTPDIVLIEFGGNDCDFKWQDIAVNPHTEHKPNTDLSTFREILTNMTSSLKGINITPVLMTLPPLDPKRYFKWISKGDPTAEKNILQWLGSVDKIYTWHSCYNEIITTVAEETSTILIDVRSEFLKQENYSKFLCIDGIHPNTEGHTLIANKFLDFINENFNFLLQETPSNKYDANIRGLSK